jgi:hypothetical protein
MHALPHRDGARAEWESCSAAGRRRALFSRADIIAAYDAYCMRHHHDDSFDSFSRHAPSIATCIGYTIG